MHSHLCYMHFFDILGWDINSRNIAEACKEAKVNNIAIPM